MANDKLSRQYQPVATKNIVPTDSVDIFAIAVVRSWHENYALAVTPHRHRHRIPNHCKVVAHPVLGGLHHEYGLLAKAA